MDNVIVVASGKGGTGKSTVCICLSVALVKQGKRVLLIDCDCGMRGLDIMLDMEQDIIFDASDAVCGNCTFGEAVYKSKNNENLYLMAAPFDTENELSPSVFTQLVNSVKDSFDFVLIDSPAGIGSGFETAAAPADRALIVTNAEPTGVRGAVKVRRKLESMGKTNIRLVINRFDRKLFTQLGFYEDLDSVIDATQTQLIALVPFDIRISVIVQRGVAGLNWRCSSALLTAVFSAATTFAPPAQQAKWCQRQQVLQFRNSLQALRAEVSRLRQELRAMRLICFSFSEIRSIQSRTSLTI